jgi:hypothetical protein
MAFRTLIAIAIAAVFPIALAIATTARAAEVSVEVGHAGGAVIVTAHARVDADAATAWRVLTDYARYRDFVPGLRTSRVVSRNGAHVTVEQTGVAPLWLLDVPIDVNYDITESPPTAVHSRALARDAGTLTSDYTLTPSDNHVVLDYRGVLTTRPSLLAPLREATGERSVVAHFRALAGEMERQARADPMGMADGARNLHP